jgi:hypothetical protein
MDNVHDQSVIVERRLCLTGTMSTDAGGAIPSYSYNTGQLSSTTGYSVMAAVWGEFRIKAMRVIIHPVYKQCYSGLTPPSVILTATFVAAELYTTAASMLDGMNSRDHSGYTSFSHGADWSVNPNAKLWTPVATGAVPNDNRYGVQIRDLGNVAATVSTTMYNVVVEYLVEWRMAA